MTIWHRLLHPWWRPTLLILNLIALLLNVGALVFHYPLSWIAPIFVVNLVTVAMIWREGWIKSDPLAQREKTPPSSGEESRPTRVSRGDRLPLPALFQLRRRIR